MELVIFLIALFFGIKILGAMIGLIFSLLIGIVRFWIFMIALCLLFLVLASLGSGRPASSTHEPPPRSEMKATPLKADADEGALWVPIIVLGVAVLATVMVIKRIRHRKQSGCQKNLLPSRLGSGSSAARLPATDRFGPARPTLLALPRPTAAVQTIVLDDYERRRMEEFRQAHPWVTIDVPALFHTGFLRECDWLRTKTQRNPSASDQLSILREVSSGWTWERRT